VVATIIRSCYGISLLPTSFCIFTTIKEDLVMALSNDEMFKASLSMIQVTPENYDKLTPDLISYVFMQISAAEYILRTMPSEDEPL
jgi:hypothetical protein